MFLCSPNQLCCRHAAFGPRPCCVYRVNKETTEPVDRRKTKRVLPLYNKNSHFGLNFCYSESIINNQTVKLHWKKVSLAENSIHMERFTTRCSYWALAYLQLRSTFLERCTGQSSQRVTFKQRGITVVIKYGDFVRIEIEMVGTSQKGLGCTAPQLSMPPALPGWLDQKEYVVENGWALSVG